MVEQNPYSILGVRPTASDEQIESAYRELAKRYHPSLNPGDNEAALWYKDVSQAYRLLKDRERRQQLDQELAASGASANARPTRRYVPERVREEATRTEYHPETGRKVRTPLATLALAIWMIFSFGFGMVRGLATELDGQVVSVERVPAPILHVAMLWARLRQMEYPSVIEYTVRQSDGQVQTFAQGPLCTLLSGSWPSEGSHIHKEAWNPAYTLDGQAASDFSSSCAIYLPVWLLIAFSMLTVGLLRWVTQRQALR